MKRLTYRPLHPGDGIVNTADVYDYSLATMHTRYRNDVPNGFLWSRVEAVRMLCYVKVVSYIKCDIDVSKSFTDWFINMDMGREIDPNANQFRNNDIDCL